MFRPLSVFLVLAFLLGTPSKLLSAEKIVQPVETHRFLFWNVLLDLAVDKWFQRRIPLWGFRKDAVLKRIKTEDPDVFGIAEMLPWQEKFISASFPEYHKVMYRWWTDAILYARKSKYDLIKSGHFFLSKTPDVKFSRDYGNFMPRIVVWMHVRLKSSGQDMVFLSTHFDGMQSSRKQSVFIVDDFLKAKFPKLPAIMPADLNISFDGVGWENASSRNWRSAFLESGIKDPLPTHHGRMVDHIVIINAPNIKVTGFKRTLREEGEILLSDHHMVQADLVLGASE